MDRIIARREIRWLRRFSQIGNQMTSQWSFASQLSLGIVELPGQDQGRRGREGSASVKRRDRQAPRRLISADGGGGNASVDPSKIEQCSLDRGREAADKMGWRGEVRTWESMTSEAIFDSPACPSR